MKRLLSIAILGFALLGQNTLAQQNRSARKLIKQGVERFARGDIAGAIADYDRALTIDPKSAEAYFKRGRAKRAQGDLNETLHDFADPVILDPPSALPHPTITAHHL